MVPFRNRAQRAWHGQGSLPAAGDGGLKSKTTLVYEQRPQTDTPGPRITRDHVGQILDKLATNRNKWL